MRVSGTFPKLESEWGSFAPQLGLSSSRTIGCYAGLWGTMTTMYGAVLTWPVSPNQQLGEGGMWVPHSGLQKS